MKNSSFDYFSLLVLGLLAGGGFLLLKNTKDPISSIIQYFSIGGKNTMLNDKILKPASQNIIQGPPNPYRLIGIDSLMFDTLVYEEKGLVERSWNILKKYLDLINKYAAKHGVESILICSFIMVESTGKSDAVNWETKIGQYSSGLMQILLPTAQYMGYTGDQKGLLNPETNIDLGTKYIKWQFGRYKRLADVIAAYNAGSVFRWTGHKFELFKSHYDETGLGEYTNQKYVDKILKYYNLFTKSLKLGV